ncbi:MAG: response regulator [Chloroflexi bacterium]|nr:response regulator [Chloroflexota bacterium]
MDEKKRVLIIDDEMLIRRALADYLTESGYETVMASNGIEGLTIARSQQFHAVLVDLRMPQVDGMEVITTLHAEQPELPVVVVSGTGVLNDAIEAMRRGASDYITKPVIDIDEIAVVVERVMEKARLVAERDQYQCELEQLNRSLEAEVARQTQDLRGQNRRLMALNRVSIAISEPLDLDTMLNRAIDSAVAAIEADGGIVQLRNPATDQLVVAAARGIPKPYLSSAQAILLGQGIVGQVVESGRPQGGSDFSNDPWLASLGEMAGFHSFLCVPLRAGDEITSFAESDKKHSIVGALGIVIQDEYEFGSHEVELLANIGNQIGVALARAQYAVDLERANVRLERANADLRRLDTLREQFIQNVAHELRTPLALAHGYIEMLTQGGLSHEEHQIALDVASRRVQALVDIVKSITTLQDLDSQPLRIEPVAPSELFQTACQMVAQRASNADIELRDTCPPSAPAFPGDFTRLAQALHQLLDNACKFSPEGSRVTISIEITKNATIISVSDQGIGIPSEEHAYIFDRFYQVDGSTTRRYGGTGLGLAIAKEIIEAHGGQITVESAVGEGSCFSIWLPFGGLTDD